MPNEPTYITVTKQLRQLLNAERHRQSRLVNRHISWTKLLIAMLLYWQRGGAKMPEEADLFLNVNFEQGT